VTSRRPRRARLASRRRRQPLRPRAPPRAMTRQSHNSRRRRRARLARPRLSRGRLRRRHRPPKLRHGFLQPHPPQTQPPRRHLNLLLWPSRLRRRRRALRRICRRLAPHRRRAPHRRQARCRRKAPGRRCRRHGGWSPRAARSLLGRFCRRPGVRQRERRNRPRRRGRRPTRLPDLHCRRPLLPACLCRRSLPTDGRSRPRRRHLVRVPASRSRRRRVPPALLLAAGARIAQVLPAGSGVQRAAVTGRTEAGRAAGALTRERRHPPGAVRADHPAVLVQEDHGEHREAVHGADLAAVVAASARNCSRSSSLPTRRSMRPFPKARSSSSEDRRLKKWPPG